MARNVNASFSGVVVSDVDPNALTRTRWLDESIADTALVHDLATGNNSPPVAIDHSGPGNGCVLGLPIANQMLFGYVSYGHLDDRAPWSIPYVHPVGETTLQVRLMFNLNFSFFNAWRVSIINTSWVEVATAPLERLGNSGTLEALIDGLTESTQYFVRVLSEEPADTLPFRGSWNLLSIVAGYFRKAPATKALIRRLTSDVEDSTELSTQTVSSATVIDYVDLDTAETQDGQAISGYHTTTLAHNQHALAEMVTGAPAGTNSSRTLAASATQSAFMDHSRLGSEFSSMPVIGRIPLFAYGLGIAPEDGGTTGDGADGFGGFDDTRNCPGWKATPSVGTAWRDLLLATCWIPYHVQSTLRVQILCYSPDGLLGSMTTTDAQVTVINANTGATVDTQAAGAAPTQLGSSKWYWWDITGMDFLQGGANQIEVAFSIAAPDAPKNDGSSMRIAGWSACLEG